MTDNHNGAKMLIEDIIAERDKKNISNKDRLLLRSMLYLLEEVPITRENIAFARVERLELQNNNILLKIKERPKIAAMLTIVFIFFNSLFTVTMIIVAGFREQVLASLVKFITGF